MLQLCIQETRRGNVEQGKQPGSRFPHSPVCKGTESVFPRHGQGGVMDKALISLEPLPSQAFLHGDGQQFSLLTLIRLFCALQACQCGKSAQNKISLAADCSPGSASALRRDASVASLTSISRLPSSVSKEKQKLKKQTKPPNPHTRFLGYHYTGCGQTVGLYAWRGCHRLRPCWDDAAQGCFVG